MVRKLSMADAKDIERERYRADYRKLIRNQPSHRGKHGYGPSLFEQYFRQQYERQSAIR